MDAHRRGSGRVLKGPTRLLVVTLEEFSALAIRKAHVPSFLRASMA
jgi:hypothetical protein